MLLDAHHHFDFLTGNELRSEFLSAVADRNVQVVAQTLLPSSFMKLMDEIDEFRSTGVPLPLWSVGVQPWWVASEDQARNELEMFRGALKMTRFVGEVGLDFAPRRLELSPAELQQHVFRQVMEATYEAAEATDERHVVSIHAVRSASVALDILEEFRVTSLNVTPVFHWFSGTSDDLTRLMRLGGCISVNEHMLESKRGRAYVKQVPADRLLLESDLPEQQVVPDCATDAGRLAQNVANELAAVLSKVLATLDELRGSDVSPKIMETQSRLFGVK